MDFGNIVTALIFIAVIIFQLRKKFKSSQPESKKNEPGWKKLVGDVFTEIKSEMEKAQQEASQQKKKKPVHLKSQSNVEWEKGHGPMAPSRMSGSGRVSGKQKVKQEKPKTTPSVATPVASTIVPALTKSEPKKRFQMASKDLKKAILWSEIIGPPLSLREDE